MPVAAVVGDERPGDGIPGQAVLDVNVVSHVDVVVVVDVGMGPDRIVQGDAKDDEQQSEKIGPLAGQCE